MWRGTAARSLLSSRLLPSRGAIPHPKPPSVLGVAVLLPSPLNSAADPGAWVRGPVVFSASSPAESAAVLGSFGFVSSAVSRKARDASEALRHYGRCYWELSKARLSMLVVATSGAGFVLGSGNVIDFAGLCCTCAGTMMVAASANSLNQVFEIQNDAKMKRTRQRPLPSGRLTVPHATIWASGIGIAGTTLLAWKANYLAAGLAACNLGLYAFVYTPLKQIHPVNTWVGAVVGAIPPLLGNPLLKLKMTVCGYAII